MIAVPETTQTERSPLAVERTVRSPSIQITWLLAAQVPLIFAYGCHLWDRPHYQFFPLAVVAAGWLAVRRMGESTDLEPGKQRTVLGLLVASFLLQVAALVIHSYWLIGISLPISLTAFLYAAGGWRLTGRCWPSLALLAICIPPPYALDHQMVTGLRTLTSTLGSDALNAIRLPHLRNGNIFEVGGRELFVEDACSGINSLFSSLCCVLVWAALIRMHWITTLILSAAAVFWLVAANVLRVALVAIGISWWNIDLTSGWKHEALGIGTFALGLFLTWSTGQFMLFFLRPHPAYATKTARPGTPLGRIPSPAVPLPMTAYGSLLGATAILALFFVGVYRNDLWLTIRDDEQIADRLNYLAEADLPVPKGLSITEFKVDHRDTYSVFGEHSRLWRVRDASFNAVASVDYPFEGWHPLTKCYTSSGWEVDQANDIPSPIGDGSTISEVVLKRSAFQSGYLLFGIYDGAGQTVSAPLVNKNFWARRNTFLSRLTGQSQTSSDKTTTYQVQVLVTGFGEPDAELRRRAAELFKATREAVSARLASERGQ